MQHKAKYQIFLGILFFMFGNINAQCIPDTTLSEPGIYPSTLPNGCVNESYSQRVDVVFPLDTLIVINPFLMFTVPYDSFVVNSVTNIPPGLDYLCGPPSCTFIPEGPGQNARGCVEIFGIPTEPFINDSIIITGTVYLTVPIIGVQSGTVAVPVAMTALNGGNTWSVQNATDEEAESLRSFIVNACMNDTILFDPILSGDTIKLVGLEIEITKSISIIGPSLNPVFISGEQNSRIFSIEPEGIILLENVNLIKGNPSEGIILNRGILSVQNVQIK